MPTPDLIAAHRKVQATAKDVLSQLAREIRPQDTEQSIASRASGALSERGIRETWYYDCPALVLSGSRSCISISGREYRPGLEPVGQTNLVTIDLSPSFMGHWGDCARSFPVEEGRVTLEPKDPNFVAGLSFLHRLKSAMSEFVTARTTFHELALWASQRLDAEGFLNLDFRANVGHSIATRREDRIYIEEGNHRLLGEVSFFTFEPHVRALRGHWGFKHEDIFFFNSAGVLEEV